MTFPRYFFYIVAGALASSLLTANLALIFPVRDIQGQLRMLILALETFSPQANDRPALIVAGPFLSPQAP
jgi:hypothetical protein